MRSKRINHIMLLLIGAFLMGCSSSEKSKSDRYSDQFPAYKFEKNGHGDAFIKQSQYLITSDDVALAIDYYQPKGPPNEKFPTILYQTKYWRSIGINFPFSLFVDELSVNPAGSYIKGLVEQGYVVVAVDIRGSGASTGAWEVPFGTREQQDAFEVCEWIVAQPWSDGQIGTIGISFSAITADVAVASNHPAIKAHMPMFGPYDLYEDLVFPGGIYHEFYLREWQNLNEVLDQDKPPVSNLLIKTAVKGAARIKGERKRFKKAKEDHKNNVNVHALARHLVYRDDPIRALGIESIDEISPHVLLRGSAIPTYAYSGWYDGGYQHAAIRRFINNPNMGSRLTIGPWDHGGGKNASPTDPGGAGFIHVTEALRFFDHHLRGLDSGLDSIDRVHYFTQIADSWQSADQWPPKGFNSQRYYLTDGGLSVEQGQGVVRIEVDSTSSAGSVTRWEALAAASATPPLYPDRRVRDRVLTSYETPVFDEDMEMTGHPIVNIAVEGDRQGSALIAYIELVSPEEQVTYMTEGRMYGLHAGSEGQSAYRDVVDQPSYERAGSVGVSDRGSYHLSFDLLPTSFLIPAGHRLRLVLATADAAHFRFLNNGKDEIAIRYGENTYLEVPLRVSTLRTQ